MPVQMYSADTAYTSITIYRWLLATHYLQRLGHLTLLLLLLYLLSIVYGSKFRRLVYFLIIIRYNSDESDFA